jgi:SnoaL-like protein
MSDNNPAIATTEDVALLQTLRKAMAEVHRSVGTTVRSQHPKGHGVVQATFRVYEVPEPYRLGVFAEARHFAAWIRFSNGRETDDLKPDVHGMAIKLLNVRDERSAAEGEHSSTQDFVLADHPVFFAKDAQSFLQFMGLKGKLGAELKKAKDEGTSAAELADLQRKQTSELVRAFPVIAEFFKTARSPLALEYFSQTPYRLGDRVVKYFATPVDVGPTEGSVPASPNVLHDSMRQVLSTERSDARFEFGIEVQTDPASMPIDDATKKWNSPERVILASITIPPQDFSSEERVSFAEALSFSPWHSLPAHQPLGSINRARRDVYVDSSVTRHEATGVSQQADTESYFNVLTLTRFFDCFTKGDVRGMQSCLHPEVEFHDIGFDLRGREVGAMWHMIVSNGIAVSCRDIKVDGQSGTAHWECDYQFRKEPDSDPRPVHNVVEAAFRFEDGLIRVHHDQCDFWKWFEQAMGPIGKGVHMLDVLEDKIERLIDGDLPLGVEERVRAKVKETADKKIKAFVAEHREYADPPRVGGPVSSVLS